MRETYKWLLAPIQHARNGNVSEIEWEAHALNPAAKSMAQEIESQLAEHELVIREWAPLHLNRLLSAWFWKPDVPTNSGVESVAGHV